MLRLYAASLLCAALLHTTAGAAFPPTAAEPEFEGFALLEQLAQKIHPNSSGKEYVAVNHAQDLISTISAKGFMISGPALSPVWETEIELVGVRRGCAPMKPWQPMEACNTGDELLWKGSGMDIHYEHSQAGMRQNFIIQGSPSGVGELQVVLQCSGDLWVESVGKRAIRFVDEFGMERFRYEDLKVWDACGTTLQAHMEADPNTGEVILHVDDRGASYPITVDPITTGSVLTNNQNASQFGWSVSSAGDVNGDGYSDVIVAAPFYSAGELNEGAAFVYYGGPNGLSAAPNVTLQSNQIDANFGWSVAHAGDLNGDGFSDIIVGAIYWESAVAVEDEGAVFVYYGSAAGISSTENVILRSNIKNGYMGWSVSGAGDLNKDGFSDIIVGSNVGANGQFNEGLVWIFRGSAAGIVATHSHLLERHQNAAQFGSSVAGAGDINGDGFDDVIIGAHRYDLTCPPSLPGCDNGAVFIYYGRNSGTNPLGPGVNPAPGLVFNSAGTSSKTGYSVAAAGDVNGDGYSDVIVGDWRDNIGGQSNEGIALVFHGSASGLNITPATVIQNNLADSWLGASVSSAGDMNGDGYADVAIGAPQYKESTGSLEGAVYIHLGGPSGISANYFIRYKGPSNGARSGTSVAVVGDINGDGYSDIIAGAPKPGSLGSALLYMGGAYPIAPITPAVGAVNPPTTPSGYPNSLAGSSVANAGDVNGDGFSDVIIGAPEASRGETNEGLAFLYYGSANGLAAVPDLILEMNAASARFGYSVSTAGDVNGDGYADVVVGAPEAGGNGRAYIFHGGVGGLSPTPALTLSGTATSRFGHSVSTAGDINGDGLSDVLIGSPSTGTVSVHLGSAGGLLAVPHVTLPNPQAGSNFGWSVSTAGDVNGDGFSDIVIGAPDMSNGQTGEGVAFVFHGSEDGLLLPYAHLLERDQAGARFGFCVAGVGDFNGDGFFDVVAGAPRWSNGQALEGSITFFPGSASGLTGAGTSIESNNANFQFGYSVAEGGDINGDGYADIVVGVPFATGGQLEEGRFHIFHGRPGVPTTAAQSLWEPNVSGRRAAWSVAGGGDVDGDGFSDVIVGSPGANADEGAHTVLRGNWSPSVSRPTRLYRADLVSPLATNALDPADGLYFGIGHLARSHMQRKPGKLKWEVVFEGQPFSTSPIVNSITNSLGFTDQSASFTDLGVNGVEIKELIYKQPWRRRYKWRVRVEWPIHRSMDGQRFSRWFYGFASAHGDIGVLPVELMDFSGEAVTDGNLLHWTTASESGTHRFGVERSNDGRTFQEVGDLSAAGDSWVMLQYQLLDRSAPEGLSYYRLRMEDLDGEVKHSDVILVMRAAGSIQVRPNPVEDLLIWDLKNDLVERLRIVDGLGRIVMDETARGGQLQGGKLSSLATGSYTLLLLDGSNNVIARSRFFKA